MSRQEILAQLDRCLAQRRQLEWQLFVMTSVRQRPQLLRELALVKQEHAQIEERLKRLQTVTVLASSPPARHRPRLLRLLLLTLALGVVGCGWLLSTDLLQAKPIQAEEPPMLAWLNQSPGHRQLLDDFQAARRAGNLNREIQTGELVLAGGGSFISNPLAELYQQRSHRWLEAGKYQEALHDIQRYEELLRRQSQPITAEDYLDEGQAYLGLGQPEAALNAFTAAISRDGNYSPGYYYAGVASFQLQDYPSATAYYRQVLSFGSSAPYYQKALAALGQLNGDPIR